MSQEYTPTSSGLAFTIPAMADVVDADTLFKALADDIATYINARTKYTYSTTAPTYNGTPGSQIWWDTNYSPPKGKIHNGTSWVTFSGAGSPTVTEGSSTGFTFSTLTNPDSDGVNYRLAVCNSGGSLVVTNAGYAQVLVVGGGGGGAALSDGGAGGGGGGVRWGTFKIPAATHTVTVGGGGASGSDGGASSLGTILKSGGGQRGLVTNSRWDGTGGGGSAGAYNSGDPAYAHTGGGAGGTLYGSNSYSGVTLSITGSSVEYGAGGVSGAGTANRGQGGGPSTAAGGSGVVILRWEI